jgi:hypothetical protein
MEAARIRFGSNLSQEIIEQHATAVYERSLRGAFNDQDHRMAKLYQSLDYKLAFQQAMHKISNFASLPKTAYEVGKPETGEPPKKRRKADMEVAIMDDVRMQIAKQK